MQPFELEGSIPVGMVCAIPNIPVAAKKSRFGVFASSRHVRLSYAGNGSPAAPSMIITQYLNVPIL
jgi:hypothetical protein